MDTLQPFLFIVFKLTTDTVFILKQKKTAVCTALDIGEIVLLPKWWRLIQCRGIVSVPLLLLETPHLL